MQNFRHYFSCIATINLLKLLRSIQIILSITKMPSFIRKGKVSCKHCGTQVTRINLFRHKKRCSAVILFCTRSPSFSTLSQDHLNYHVAKRNSVLRTSITYKCKLCHAEFPGFYALLQQKNTQHGTQNGFGASNFDVEHIVGDVVDRSLTEGLQSCRHFLVDSEIQKRRHSVFNFCCQEPYSSGYPRKIGSRSG